MGTRTRGFWRIPPGSKVEYTSSKNDHEFLLRGEIFSEKLIESWIEYKVKRELNPISEMLPPYEFAVYYDTCASAGERERETQVNL